MQNTACRILLLGLFVLSGTTLTAADAWWNRDWDFRTPLTIKETQGVEHTRAPYAVPVAATPVSRDLFCELRKRGTERYLFLFNPTEQKVASDADLAGSAGAVADYFTGVRSETKPAGDNRVRFATEVAPGNWRVYRLNP